MDIELEANNENQDKVVPVNDKENNQSFKTSVFSFSKFSNIIIDSFITTLSNRC